jgi:hypothetical protein
VARVDVPTGGTAFAVGDRLALTAFHVVGDRAAGIVRQRDVRLDFGGWTVIAHVDPRTASDADAALLHLESALPPEIVPITLTDQVPHGRWLARGFPRDDPSFTARSVDGTIVDADQRQPQTGAAVIALYCQQAAAGSPQPLAGFSGAPVLAGQPERAIGLIRWNPTNPGQPGVAQGGTVYACPVRSMLSRWPELSELTRAAGEASHDTAEVAHLKNLIAQYERNLHATEMQMSQYAPSERPLHLINQQTGISGELRALRERLGRV